MISRILHLLFLISLYILSVDSHTKVELKNSTKMENSYKTIAKSCIAFSSSVYKIIASINEKNVASSPLSAHILLSYLCHGAAGKTEEELKTHLHFSKTTDEHNEYRDLIATFNDVHDIELNIANIIYVHKQIALLPAFVANGIDIFSSDISSIDFGQNREAVQKINSWVEGKTNKRISNIVSTDTIDKNTKVVLVNAIYFKGEWLHKFQPNATALGEFHVSKDVTKHVSMMYAKCKFAHGEVPSFDAKFIEIPYLNEDFDMVILLPNEIDGLRELEKNFDWDAIKLDFQRKENEIKLKLPRFKVEMTIDLKAVLQKLGLESMFSDTANFSKITRSDSLKVDKVLQKVFVEVNEAGSEAAAATKVAIRCKRMVYNEEINVDRPFMYLIRHKSNIPLFIGSVRDLVDEREESLTPSAKDEL